MSRNEIILTVAAAALIGFSLIVSLLVPRWRPDFPGRRTGPLRGRGGAVRLRDARRGRGLRRRGGSRRGGRSRDRSTKDPAAARRRSRSPTPARRPAATDTGGGSGDADRSRRARRSSRPTAAAAATRWRRRARPARPGPNLDELQPSFDAVVGQVTDGGGGMPAFGGHALAPSRSTPSRRTSSTPRAGSRREPTGLAGSLRKAERAGFEPATQLSAEYAISSRAP